MHGPIINDLSGTLKVHRDNPGRLGICECCGFLVWAHWRYCWQCQGYRLDFDPARTETHIEKLAREGWRGVALQDLAA